MANYCRAVIKSPRGTQVMFLPLSWAWWWTNPVHIHAVALCAIWDIQYAILDILPCWCMRKPLEELRCQLISTTCSYPLCPGAREVFAPWGVALRAASALHPHRPDQPIREGQGHLLLLLRSGQHLKSSVCKISFIRKGQANLYVVLHMYPGVNFLLWRLEIDVHTMKSRTRVILFSKRTGAHFRFKQLVDFSTYNTQISCLTSATVKHVIRNKSN